ncbi:uncharacterized protein N7459_001110 [Penicillium hispanicum]|uniref:uncharacterized protein n=1 Tax=Penicillium hispanicum TaxID=1080232 RepID=UPI0025420EF8|nr:uncharacterized protein N7459_001110 [Penicillium hispanicum]KAJ5594902.1 hypothetical protein N7459_001110 [Penicillium hispanicum]
MGWCAGGIPCCDRSHHGLESTRAINRDGDGEATERAGVDGTGAPEMGRHQAALADRSGGPGDYRCSRGVEGPKHRLIEQ